MVFIEDYDINVCRHLMQGVDVWLNNPRRPLEASGTSGRRPCSTAASTSRSSTAGGPKPTTARTASPSATARSHVVDEITDHRDAERPVSTCSNDEVIPLFYDRDVDGLPRQLDPADDELDQLAGLAVQRHRMVMDYVRSSYLPAAGGLSCDMSVR